MEIKKFEFNLFGENTYVLWDAATLEAAVVDPGMCDDGEMAVFDSFVAGLGLSLKAVLLTHIHIDHTFGVDHVRERYPQVRVYAHPADAPLGKTRDEQARMFRLPYRLGPLVADVFVNEGEVVELGGERIEILHAPGHSPGSLLYYVPSSGFVLTGDVLFRGSIGRTDLHGGNHAELLHSIASKVVRLPKETVVYPGHGPSTTVGYEMAHNPYL
ncbi:MAG: MBL fold metallo-hydrolase [Muribaculaceae bacterium]|nr:MBL fold metallo-hydrolase [Muribaculaceae bacterium]